MNFADRGENRRRLHDPDGGAKELQGREKQMHLLSERHSVAIAQGDDTQVVATADLCSDDDTLAALRGRVVLAGSAYFGIADCNALRQAFDEAFNRCELCPGDDASGTVAFEGGEITVTRRLAA